MPRFSANIGKLSSSGIRSFFDAVTEGGNIISLGVGESNFSSPWHIRQAGITSLRDGMTSYTTNQGLIELRKSISAYLKTRYALTYDPNEEILVTAGSSQGLDLIFRVLLDPGDEVIIFDPGYVCYKPLVSILGAVPVFVDTSLSQFIPDIEHLKTYLTDKTKLMILCSPSNPTGVIIPDYILESLASLAIENDLWVISDEIYSELNYSTTMPATSIAKYPGMKERTVVVNGFSKSFAMTGFRIGYIASIESVVSSALKIFQYSMLCTPTLSQIVAIEALENGLDSVAMMKESYNERRLIAISRSMEMGFDFPNPDGGFFIFLSIAFTKMSSKEFSLALFHKEGVVTIPGDIFGDAGMGYIRCCYATSKKCLIEAFDRIYRFIKEVCHV